MLHHVLVPVAIAVVLVLLLAWAIRGVINNGGHPAVAVAGVLVAALLIWLVLVIWHGVTGTSFGFIRWSGWSWSALLILAAVVTALIMAARSSGIALLAALAAFVLLFGGVAPASAKEQAKVAVDKKVKCNSVTVYHELKDAAGHHCYTDPPPPPPTKPSDQCLDGHNVVLDNNESNRLMSAGVTGTPDEVVDKVMKAAAHDNRILKVYWNASPLGKKTPVADEAELVDNGCYSAKGVKIYNDTLTQYTSAAVSPDTAPSSGVNTGATQNGAAFQTQPGTITGDMTATKVVFANGDVIWILHRCGNLERSQPIPGLTTETGTTTPVVTNTTVSVSTTVARVTTTVATSTTKPANSSTTSTPTGPTTTIKCNGQVVHADGTCGTATAGADNNNRVDPGRTTGVTVGTDEAVVASQHTTDSVARAGNAATTAGIDSGSYDNNTNVIAGGSTNNTSDPAGSSTGFTTQPTTTPDSGQTNGSAGTFCDPSRC